MKEEDEPEGGKDALLAGEEKKDERLERLEERKIIGKTVIIIRGPYKCNVGIVKTIDGLVVLFII